MAYRDPEKQKKVIRRKMLKKVPLSEMKQYANDRGLTVPEYVEVMGEQAKRARRRENNEKSQRAL